MTLSFTSPLSTRTWSFPLPYFLNTALWSFWWDQFQCLHYLDDIHVITAGPYRQYESLSFPFVSFSVLFIFVFTANASSNLSLNCLLGEGLKHHLVGDRCQSTTLVVPDWGGCFPRLDSTDWTPCFPFPMSCSF